MYFRKFPTDGPYRIAFILNNGWIIGFLICWLIVTPLVALFCLKTVFVPPSLSGVDGKKLHFEAFALSAGGRDRDLEQAFKWKCPDLAKFFFKFSKPYLTSTPLCLCVSCFLDFTKSYSSPFYILLDCLFLCQGLRYSQAEWSIPFFFICLSSYYNAVHIIGFPPCSTRLGASWGYGFLISLCIY